MVISYNKIFVEACHVKIEIELVVVEGMTYRIRLKKDHLLQMVLLLP